jgi:hypothetical protein
LGLAFVFNLKRIAVGICAVLTDREISTGFMVEGSQSYVEFDVY